MVKQRLEIEIKSWLDANSECATARRHWLVFRRRYLLRVLKELPPRERLHLRHTAFRINGLMYLYAKLRRAKHSTQLGVLCGLITHLLDYAYDRCSLSSEELLQIEQLVCGEEQPVPGNPLQEALYELCNLAWSLVPNPRSVRSALAAMLRTQRESLLQNRTSASRILPREELEQITLAKGHNSVCLYFSIANPSFSSEEARHLVAFGLYMQYMDDLEDFYEDLSDSRTSPVSTIRAGLGEASRLLSIAKPELATFYNNPSYEYDLVWGRLVFYHRALSVACIMREWIRRLPLTLRRILHILKEGLSFFVPFLYTAPID